MHHLRGKKNEIHGIPIADSCEGAVMQKPLTVQQCFRLDISRDARKKGRNGRMARRKECKEGRKVGIEGKKGERKEGKNGKKGGMERIE